MRKKINLKLSSEDSSVGYVQLPKHPKKVIPSGIVKKTIWLFDLLPNYKGPSIYLDFDKDDELIGIEIIGDEEVKKS